MPSHSSICHERRFADTVKAAISASPSRKKPFSIAIDHLGNSLDRCELMTEAELDHSPDALGIGGWRHPAPFALDDVEHFRIGHSQKRSTSSSTVIG